MNVSPIERLLPRPFTMAVTLIVVFAALSVILVGRAEAPPERQQFVAFPLAIEGWVGRTKKLEDRIVEVLNVEDYFLANFTNAQPQDFVNFYVAYYDSQRLGSASHSPRSCIPGGGWSIDRISTHGVEGLLDGETPLFVNRALISKGQVRQLVYYWFEQRGRQITSEYDAKWFLFWDGLTRNRTDGALLRLVTPIFGTEAEADQRLTRFLKAIYPNLSPYIPA